MKKPFLMVIMALKVEKEAE